MSYAWADIQTSGLTIHLLIRRKSDMHIWNGSTFVLDSTLSDAELLSAVIAFTEVKSSSGTTLGYKANIPAAITVKTELFGYVGGYTAGSTANLQGDDLPEIDQILEDTGTTLPASLSTMWTTALTESYAADGAAFTPAQALYMLWSVVSEFAVSGVTITTKKLDGTTTAMTFTMDSATAPTLRGRAT